MIAKGSSASKNSKLTLRNQEVKTLHATVESFGEKQLKASCLKDLCHFGIFLEEEVRNTKILGLQGPLVWFYLNIPRNFNVGLMVVSTVYRPSMS